MTRGQKSELPLGFWKSRMQTITYLGLQNRFHGLCSLLGSSLAGPRQGGTRMELSQQPVLLRHPSHCKVGSMLTGQFLLFFLINGTAGSSKLQPWCYLFRFRV